MLRTSQQHVINKEHLDYFNSEQFFEKKKSSKEVKF